jgi:cephalosporin hydroxylase
MEHFYHTVGEDWFTYPDLYSKMAEYFPDHAHFVEVGSWKGRSAAYMAVEIFNSGKVIKFDCIDTWDGSDEHVNPESPSFNPDIVSDPNWLFLTFLKNISPVRHIINPVRTTSIEAASRYLDRSLDFVFIDAAHDYDNVKADIEAWFAKVKKGGYIGGHDYSESWLGVVNAVNEFLSNSFIKRENIFIDNSEVIWLYKK